MKFNKTQKKKIYRKALDKFGLEKQLGMLMEECMELGIAAHKYLRYHTTSVQPLRNLAEEIGDVEIMIEQIKQYLKEKNEDITMMIETSKNEKLERLRGILEK